MNSSISSSERAYRKKFMIFGIASVLLLAVAGGINYLLLSTVEKKVFEEEMATAKFWQEKTTPSHSYAVLILGDSRTYRGVNPTVVGRILDLKCYNLGFSSGGLNREIFDLAETKLDPAASRIVIVLGISPLTLSEESRSNEHYKSLLAQQVRFESRRSILQTFFYPMGHERWNVIRKNLKPDKRKRPPTYCDSGWMSTDKPFSSEDYEKGLQLYRARASQYVFSPESLAELTQAVRGWKKRGFHVFAYRPPTPKEMIEIESVTYDEARVKKAFGEAGGCWLDFPDDAYSTYDASHLTTESSRKFSSDLAHKILDRLTVKDAE